MSKDIGFYTIPLKHPIEEVRKGLSDDELLHDAIVYYVDQLAEKDIETWLIEKNMAVTEDGYKIALPKKEETPIIDKYMDLCEKTIVHLMTLIGEKNLAKYFAPDELKVAREIIKIHKSRNEEIRDQTQGDG